MSSDMCIKQLSGSLSITRGAARDLMEEAQYSQSLWLAEGCFLHALPLKRKEGGDETVLQIEDPSWYGEGSDEVDSLKKILSHTRGTAHLLLIWGDGTLSGFEVEDGKVTDMEASVYLVDKRK